MNVYLCLRLIGSMKLWAEGIGHRVDYNGAWIICYAN